MTVAIVLIYAVGSSSVMSGFLALEQTDTKDSASRVRDALVQQIDGLDRTISNWSSWDDTYTWIEDGNTAFVASNLGDSVFGQMGANLLVFVDANGGVVWAKSADLASGTVVASIPSDMAPFIAAGSKLLSHPDLTAAVKGIVNLSEGPMMVASRPILTSDASGPSHGTMIIGRFLDTAEVATLSDLTHVSLSVTQFSDGRMPVGAQADVESLASGLSAAAPLAAAPLDDKRIEGYALMSDLEGKPAVILRLDLPREVYSQGQQTLGLLLLLLPLLGGAIDFTSADALAGTWPPAN